MIFRAGDLIRYKYASIVSSSSQWLVLQVHDAVTRYIFVGGIENDLIQTEFEEMIKFSCDKV